MDNKNIALEIANAIVKDLWLKGLITDKEKENAMEKNQVAFTSTNC